MGAMAYQHEYVPLADQSQSPASEKHIVGEKKRSQRLRICQWILLLELANVLFFVGAFLSLAKVAELRQTPIEDCRLMPQARTLGQWLMDVR